MGGGSYGTNDGSERIVLFVNFRLTIDFGRAWVMRNKTFLNARVNGRRIESVSDRV